MTTLLNRPIAVLAWTSALLLAGLWTAFRVPLEWTPQVELPVIHIDASWPGASPRAVERYVTAPIERALQRVPGTASIESYSQEGGTTITLEVTESTDLGRYTLEVNEQLMLLRSELPERVTPRLTRQIPEALRDQQGFMTLQLIGPTAPDVLRRQAEETIAPRLRSLPGVADVLIEGGSRREVLVTLDPERLATYGLGPEPIRQRLLSVLSDAVYGQLNTTPFDVPGRQFLLLTPAVQDLTTLQQLVIDTTPGGQPIRLSDVAHVKLGPAPVYSIGRIDGQAVITLTVDRARGSHMLTVAEALLDRLQALRPALPEGVRLLVADDKSEAVRAQLRDLSWRGGLGLVLVVLALLFMLKSVRAVGVVLFTVAVALAMALLLLQPLGLTLNLLTLAGLVLIFGLLVDNAVVMVEQLQWQRSRLQQEGLAGLALHATCTGAALEAVWTPLLGGTLSTMIVMLPLIYLSGELQALFVPFGLLTALTLLASLGTAAVLIPVLARWLPTDITSPELKPRRVVWMIPFGVVSRFPRTTLLALVLLLGLPLWSLPNTLDTDDADSNPVQRLSRLYNSTIGSEPAGNVRQWLDPALGGVMRTFFRDVNFGRRWSYQARPEVYVRLSFPPGNPIERADTLLQRFEQTALASASVSRTIVRIGERQASMRVQFTDASFQTVEPYAVRERLIQEAVNLAGIGVSVGGLLPEGYYSRSGANISGLTVEAYGSNYEDLEDLASVFAARLKRSRRVAAVNINAGRWGQAQETREVLRFRWSAEAKARSGIEAYQLAGHLRPILSTRFPVYYADFEDETQLPVRVVIDEAERLDVAELMEQPLILNDTTQLQMAHLTDFSIEQTPGSIERYNQQYKRYILIDYRGPFQMGNDFLERALDAMPVPAGYRLERSSYSFFDEEVQSAFGWVLLATLILVFLITAAVFESWTLPWVVLLSLPMAAVGVALGFLWTGANFAEGAFIGTVLLVGIAVNDNILLVDRYRQLRLKNIRLGKNQAIQQAVQDRLRPMWTTTLSSIMAMLPLLVFPDQSGFWMGLAVTVTGGLFASTLLAPLATVSLYSLSTEHNLSEFDHVHRLRELPELDRNSSTQVT